MMNMRNLLPDGSTSKDIKSGTAWAPQWKGPRTIIFGHDAQRGFQRTPMAIGLDTGAVYGRHLTAIILPQRELVEVQSAKIYSDPGPKKVSISRSVRKCYQRFDKEGTYVPMVKALIRLVMIFILLRILVAVLNRLPD